MPTHAERIAKLEADSGWIKEGLEKVADSQTALHTKMDLHMAAVPPLNNHGLNISIGRKTLIGIISVVPLTGGIGALLRTLGII